MVSDAEDSTKSRGGSDVGVDESSSFSETVYRLRESQNPPLSGLQKQGHSNDNVEKSENGMQENGDKSG